MRHPCRIRFDILNLWPRFSKKEIVQDKCIISEMTSNTFEDCDHMFIPEFLELARYANMRFNAMYYTPDRGSELTAELA